MRRGSTEFSRFKCDDDEIGQLADGFNAFVEKISQLIQSTAHSSSALIEAVARTSEKTGRITDKILEQEARTDQVATAVKEMTATIAEQAADQRGLFRIKGVGSKGSVSIDISI